ncbi:hypothetical protein CEB3_c19770 [Peptococcaceae bacterium CEB3]|nr:hypothetical protein CEB3_c19770 [Peptococcaceae bacterium CEB3]
MIRNNLSEIMGRKRLKITQLAEMAGVNKNTVLNLYHDASTRIEFQVMDKLCAALHCQPGDLFEYVEEGDNE